MSIISQINRLTSNVSSAFTAISNKGGTMPSSQTSDYLATAIATIPTYNIQSSKSVSYTSNGTYTVTPDSGYDGVASVSVTANVPSPTYYIVVTVDSGATVTATNGTETVTGTSTGTCTLTVHSTGTWTVTATLSGVTASTTVEITNSYSCTLTSVTLTIAGTGSTSTTTNYYGSYILYNGTQYTSASSITVTNGDTIDIVAKTGYATKSSSSIYGVVGVKLNETTVGNKTTKSSSPSFETIYTYTATTSATITLVSGSVSMSSVTKYVTIVES